MVVSGTQTLSQAATICETYSQKRVDSSSSDGQDGVSKPELAFKAHPLGVKPSGNSLAASENSVSNMGFFGGLPDETVLVLLVEAFMLILRVTNCGKTYSSCTPTSCSLRFHLQTSSFYVQHHPLPYQLRSCHSTLL
jgi:hypothetical protein